MADKNTKLQILSETGERLAAVDLPELPTDLALVGVQAEIGKPTRERMRGAAWTTDLILTLTFHGLPEGKLKKRTLKLSIAIQPGQS